MLAILWRERAAFVDLFWSRQTVEPVNSMKFHRSIAALVVLVVIAQVVFVLLYRLKVSN